MRETGRALVGCPGRERACLGAILLGGLALRLFGLRWSLPRADLNPDARRGT